MLEQIKLFSQNKRYEVKSSEVIFKLINTGYATCVKIRTLLISENIKHIFLGIQTLNISYVPRLTIIKTKNN